MVRLPKKIVDSANFHFVVLKSRNLESLLNFLGGFRFPTLRAGPIDALAWVPWLVGPLARRPSHVPVPPGVAVSKRVGLVPIGLVAPGLVRWVLLFLGGLTPGPVLWLRSCSLCNGLPPGWNPCRLFWSTGCLYCLLLVRGDYFFPCSCGLMLGVFSI